MQKNGFKEPLLFKDKSGLDMKVPKSDFTVGDVRQCVGKFFLSVQCLERGNGVSNFIVFFYSLISFHYQTLFLF